MNSDTKMGLTRRQAMAGAAVLLAATRARAAEAPPAPDMAQGKVYDAADPARRGIAGVMVSNGEAVTLTDDEGRWGLPVADGDSVFVIKPPGWMPPVEAATALPRFAYVHAPNGTPAELGLRYHGLAPTGPLPPSIDFPLHRQEEQAAFRAVLLNDPQPESLAELQYVRDDVAARIAEAAGDAAFGITLGDVMFDDLSFYDRHNRNLGALGLPWWNLPGNHDMNFEAPDDRYSRETFKRVFGARTCAFQHGEATFLLLDDVEYLGTDPARPNGGGKYRGRFGARQLAFVRNVLAQVPPERLVVVCFHIPLRTAVGSEPNTAAVDADALLGVLAGHPHCVSFAGHTHSNEHHYLGTDEAHHHHVLAAGSGSWWSGPFDERGIPVALQSDGCPNGFHLLEVDGSACSTRFVAAHDANPGQLRLVLDGQIHATTREVIREYRPGQLLAGPVAAAAVGSTRLVANLFDGGPRSTLEVRFGAGAPWQAMQRTARTDPFVEEVFERNGATRKPWVKPIKSTHVWQIGLPEQLAPGSYRVSVRATDEHGRPHAATMLLEVTG
jgi:3',5'-cyclic AMP phosphodiesterase CpdA